MTFLFNATIKKTVPRAVTNKFNKKFVILVFKEKERKEMKKKKEEKKYP